MKVLRAHKIRLNPTAEQEQYFMRASGIARFAYNWSLTEYKRIKAKGQKADFNKIIKSFRAAIDGDFPFVREVTKCAPEQGIRDLRQSIATYYKARNSGRVKFPGYRSRSRRVGGFGIANNTFRIDGYAIRVPKLGWINMTEPLRFSGKIMSGRIVENAGRWYVVISVELERPVSNATGSIGIDFGLSRFATLSNGKVYETQGHYRRSERKLRSLNRSLARKRKGSSNWRKQKVRVSRLHRHVVNQRKDFHHKFTTSVTQQFSVVCIEDLNLKGLCQTRLAKSFSDAGIGYAVNMLAYKAAILQKVDRFFASTKLCHICGRKNGMLLLSDRTWLCECGAFHDRDLNAAKNIELEGLALLVGSGYVHVTPVEFASST